MPALADADTIPEVDILDQVSPAVPYVVRLHNDDVNVVEYVVLVLQRVLQCSQEKAVQHAFTAHTEGLDVVFSGTLTESEQIALSLLSAQLRADVTKASN